VSSAVDAGGLRAGGAELSPARSRGGGQAIGAGAFIGAGPVADARPLPDDWWRLYDDPRLDALVAQALAANTDLRMADANLRRALAMLGESEARRQVQGGLSAETGWTQRSAEQVLSKVQPSEKETYDMGVSVSYDLDLFGGLRRGSRRRVPTARRRAPRAIWRRSMWWPRRRAPMPISAIWAIRPMCWAS
jgi:outer membrane protein TolC